VPRHQGWGSGISMLCRAIANAVVTRSSASGSFALVGVEEVKMSEQEEMVFAESLRGDIACVRSWVTSTPRAPGRAVKGSVGILPS
jgi:hypothetical protein